MKAFIISTSLFILLSFLVISFALFSGLKIEKLQSAAEEAALYTLSDEPEESLRLFCALQKDWKKLHIPLLLSIHHSALKPIELAMIDAETAIMLQNKDSLYTALIRLAHEFASLADDLMRPAL